MLVVAPKPDSTRIRRTLEELAGIGPGWAGTSGERERRKYVVGRFEELGYAPELEGFPYLAGADDAESRLTSTVLGDVATRPVQYTAAASVTGSVVPIGQARPEDFAALDAAGVRLEGRVCLARTPMPFAITPELARRGATGLIVHADTADELIPHYAGRGFPAPLDPPWDGAYADIPGVTVSRGAGDRLLAAHQSGVGEVSIAHLTTYREAESANVVGVIGAASERFVLMAAHYDTQIAGGVWDNTTGLAALLELARIARGVDTSVCGVRFVAVGCEEQLMWGSHHYAARHADELVDGCVAMMNWDSPSAAYPVKNTCWCSEAVRPACEDAAARANWPIDVWEGEDFALSDTAPFARLGVPTMWFWQYPPMHPYYHSEGDTLDLVDADRLADVVQVGACALESQLA